MIDRLIRIYGFEHPAVIRFCALCEEWEENDWNDHALAIFADALEFSAEVDSEEE